MAKSKLRKSSKKPVLIILGLSLIISIGYLAFRTYFTPQQTQIMEIAPVSLAYGDTTIEGSLQKDYARNIFVLVLPDRRTIDLDVKGVEKLISLPVNVSGNLSPDLTMKVSKITVQKL